LPHWSLQASVHLSGTMSEAVEWYNAYTALDGTVSVLVNESMDVESTRARMKLNKTLENSKSELSRLERILAKMENNPMAYQIGEGELQRRKGLMADLKRSVATADDKLNSRGGSRFGYAARREKEYNEDDETRGVSDRSLLQQQHAMRDRHDQKLDGILSGVTKLKVMGQEINQELDLHTRLLDDLDGAVTATDERIVTNIKKVDHIDRKSGGCCHLITIMLLFALIVFFAASNLPCHIFRPSKC